MISIPDLLVVVTAASVVSGPSFSPTILQPISLLSVGFYTMTFGQKA